MHPKLFISLISSAFIASAAFTGCSENVESTLPVEFNANEVDVMLSSDSDLIVAQRKDKERLTWTLNDVAADQKMEGLKCKVSDGQYSDVLNDCIKIDEKKKTERRQRNWSYTIRRPYRHDYWSETG